jgi:hypothetical protein
MKMKVAGFVYLQNIGLNRIPSSAVLSYDFLRSICGPIGLGRTVMASTQWESVLYDPSTGEIRERMLQGVWADVLAQGAVYRRIDAVDPRCDTEGIVDYILRNYAVASQTQNVLFGWDKRVAEAEQRHRETLKIWLRDPKTREPSEQMGGAGFVDWVRGLFRSKNKGVPPQQVPLFSSRFFLEADFCYPCDTLSRVSD